MVNIIDILQTLKRPKILVRAARLGLAEYNRDRELRRITKTSRNTCQQTVFDRLLAHENRLEYARCNGDASYSIQRHIQVLTAVLAEAKLIMKRNKNAA
jgi:hypothetical protein